MQLFSQNHKLENHNLKFIKTRQRNKINMYKVLNRVLKSLFGNIHKIKPTFVLIISIFHYTNCKNI